MSGRSQNDALHKYQSLATEDTEITEIRNPKSKYDDLLKKSEKTYFRHSGESRIESGAGAGIQLFQILKNSLHSGFHRSDDFLREHQISAAGIFSSGIRKVFFVL
jgi:hypothetical protein